jgi:DNA modification methylase
VTTNIIVGDVLDGLAQIADESVHCVVTSPPYWGLRDYGTARWEGGSSICEHVSHTIRTGTGMTALGEKYRGGGKKATPEKPIQFSSICAKCGADRADDQIGLEATPEAYIARLVGVFREVRRVLRADGTLWLNIGDSYQSGKGASHGVDRKNGARRFGCRPNDRVIAGLKSKDLVGIPWMLAFALRDDGWYLRQEIIWAKSNPMPESVRDRCTKAHEHIFLLSKSRRYFFDATAMQEDGVDNERRGERNRNTESKGNGRKGLPPYHAQYATSHSNLDIVPRGLKRNKRSVWSVATRPFKGAHFATFPPALIEPCILAGSPVGGMVLDPFGGAGTVGMVADWHGRDATLVELNPEYADMARKRIAEDRARRAAKPIPGQRRVKMTMDDVAAILPPTPLEAWLKEHTA